MDKLVKYSSTSLFLSCIDAFKRFEHAMAMYVPAPLEERGEVNPSGGAKSGWMSA